MKIRIGSRESKLAVIQSEIVIDAIKKYDPSIEIELITMKTTGDKVLNKTLDKIGGKGLFTKELERALLEEKVDLLVHSYKDMPMEIDDRLPVCAVSNREDPRDVLVLPLSKREIDFEKPIGCSSLRRKVQFETLYPRAKVIPIRGNVLSRLEKLDKGEFSAIILAAAGLKRLRLESRITRYFEEEDMLPAACQGVLAVQVRRGFDIGFLKEFASSEEMQISNAERSFIAALDGGCSSPVAAYGRLDEEGKLILTGMFVGEANTVYKETLKGELMEGVTMGKSLAERFKEEHGHYER